MNNNTGKSYTFQELSDMPKPEAELTEQEAMDAEQWEWALEQANEDPGIKNLRERRGRSLLQWDQTKALADKRVVEIAKRIFRSGVRP